MIVEPANLLHGMQSMPLFRDLGRKETEEILRAAAWRQIEAGEYFFLQGDPAERVYLLVEGRVRLLQVTQDGQQIVFKVAAPWNLMAVVALVQGTSYPVSAQAVENSRALSWPRDYLNGFAQKSPALAFGVMELMAASVQEFQDKLREQATERVERRLARTILRLANQTGKKIPEGVLIDMPLSRQDLAEMTGATLYTISRILSQWENQELVISGRERLVIRWPHGVVAIAEDIRDKTRSLD